MKKFFIGATATLAAIGVFWAAAPGAQAAVYDPFSDKDKGICTTDAAKKNSPACSTDGSNPLTGPNGIIIKVAGVVASVAGVVAVIMMVIGGFMYVASGGDSGKVTTAKHTVIYATVGLVVILLAQGIVIFVVNRL